MIIKLTCKFVWSMIRHWWAKARGYRVIAPLGVRSYREGVCHRCALRDDDICSRCGCLVLSKTMMALERCPENYWGPAWVRSS